jgi:hypothetical protein
MQITGWETLVSTEDDITELLRAQRSLNDSKIARYMFNKSE